MKIGGYFIKVVEIQALLLQLKADVHIAEDQERGIYGAVRMRGCEGEPGKVTGYEERFLVPYAAVENLDFPAAHRFAAVILPVDFRRGMIFAALDCKRQFVL